MTSDPDFLRDCRQEQSVHVGGAADVGAAPGVRGWRQQIWEEAAPGALDGFVYRDFLPEVVLITFFVPSSELDPSLCQSKRIENMWSPGPGVR